MAIKNPGSDLKDELTVMQEIEKISAFQMKQIKELREYDRKLQEDNTRRLIDLEKEGYLKSEEEIAAYRQALEEEAREKTFQEQLRTNQEIIKHYYKTKDKNEKEAFKEAQKFTKEAQREKIKDDWDEAGGTLGKIKETFKEFEHQKTAGLKQTVKETGTENLIKVMKGIGKAITEGLNQINQSISKYAQYQTAINTRLQGTGRDFSNIAKTINKVAFSPLVKAESLYENVNKLVEEGVSYNLEQRAFLMTVKDGIATTFDADNQTLRRLIRIQQQDSTAARLGMESYLTRFLNEFVNTTEYLTSTFDTVADHLLEASAILGSADASAEFEYVVQKWLGTLTGIGLSDATANAIAQAIGEIGAGDISNLGAGGIQSLMIMAAARSGLDYAKILSSGLDSVDVNKLMLGVVNYMKDIGASSSNVVKNQLAKTFGVSVSDLVAVSKNLSGENLASVYNSMMSYTNMETELSNEIKSLPSRIGIANILENLMSNITFQTGMNIAANPVTYATWKIADLISSVTGGISIPWVTALGSGIGLDTTVENLVKQGIVGVSFMSNIGKIISGISNIGNGETLLEALNIGAGRGLEIQQRGQGLSTYTLENSGVKKLTSGTTTSASAYIGNTEGSAYSDTAVEEAKQPANKELEQAENDPNKSVLAYLNKEVQLAERLKLIEEHLKNMDEGITIKTVSSTPNGWTTENSVGRA